MSSRTTTVATETVSAAAAHDLVAATTRTAAELGFAVVVVVVDTAGDLKAFLRMDGTVHATIKVAQVKAHTAAMFGLPSDAWYDVVKHEEHMLHSLFNLTDFTMFGGGHPIMVNGQLVGAIGVSGAPSGEQDSDCVRAALSASGF